MPVIKTGSKFRIPNVPGTGTKGQKTKQLQAIKASQARRKKGKTLADELIG